MIANLFSTIGWLMLYLATVGVAKRLLNTNIKIISPIVVDNDDDGIIKWGIAAYWPFFIPIVLFARLMIVIGKWLSLISGDYFKE